MADNHGLSAEDDVRGNEHAFMLELNAWSGYAQELERRLQELAGADGIDGVPVDQWITQTREFWRVPPRRPPGGAGP